jgi:HSP20 family molecular chaperone IbpA
MATFDLTPFYHATVGFDRISSLLADALERDETGFPPYNIEKDRRRRLPRRDGPCGVLERRFGDRD